ncbi:hypothetical protein AB0C65_35930 [Nocardia sp. NPDC048505]|uniref:hypothetical protein n=1 Tax=Nocardia sp. NPDC048505 TaxID=3155756 RepID=UPI0033DFDBF5
MSIKRPRYFHGGVPGLAAGDIIIPRNELPDGSFDRIATSEGYPADPAMTYFSERVKVARAYAMRFANSPTPAAREGWVYEVRPVPAEAITLDSDFIASAKCWCAPRCEIVAVIERAVPGGYRAINRILGPYMEWTDGRAVYTREGYMTICPELRKQGFTDAHLRPLGPWISVDHIRYNADEQRLYVWRP